MANGRQGNIHWVDTAGDLSTEKNIKVAHIFVTATAASAILVLSDTSDNNLLELRQPTSGLTLHIPCESVPLVFPKGLKAKTVTNCTVAIVYTSKGQDA